MIIHNIAAAEDISVVYNTVANLYFDKKIWQPLKNQKILESKNFKIGLVSRDYSHKNIDILPKVKEVLKYVNITENVIVDKYNKILIENNFLEKANNNNFELNVKNIKRYSLRTLLTFIRSTPFLL